MSIPKPGDYGWGKHENGTVALGVVREATTVSAGWFKKKTIPVAIWDNNAGRILDVTRLVEWHPIGAQECPAAEWNPRTLGRSSHPEH